MKHRRKSCFYNDNPYESVSGILSLLDFFTVEKVLLFHNRIAINKGNKKFKLFLMKWIPFGQDKL